MNRCLPNNMELIGLNFNTLCNRVATGIPVANSCDRQKCPVTHFARDFTTGKPVAKFLQLRCDYLRKCKC